MTEERVQALLDKIVTIKSNPHYRIGDIYFNRGLRYQDSAASILELKEFDDSILKNYLIRNKGCEKKNIPLLAELIDDAARNKLYALPEKNELVIHIRAGDVVEHDWFLSKDYINEISQHTVSRCSLVVCFSYQEFAEKAWWLYTEEKNGENLEAVRKLLSLLLKTFPEIQFDIISNTDMDQDLVYMARASSFIRDVGGFSDLAIRIQKFNRLKAAGKIPKDHASAWNRFKFSLLQFHLR